MPPADETDRAVRRLQADYWARVDDLDPAAPDALFTDDCVFELGSLTLRGRGEIAAFFRRRQEQSAASGRVTRHLPANLRLDLVDARTVSAFSTVMVMSGHGPLPIASGLPSVGDFEDLCVRADDGRWLFARRKATSVFAGPDAAAFARAAPAPADANGDRA